MEKKEIKSKTEQTIVVIVSVDQGHQVQDQGHIV